MVALTLRKLAVVIALFAWPGLVMGLQLMGDDEMADISGQDGISVSINNIDYNVDMAWEDTTGLGPGSGFEEFGMVLARTVLTTAGSIDIDIDAGSGAVGVAGGVIQLQVSLPEMTFSQFRVYVGGVGVGSVTSGAGLERFNDFRDRIDTNTPPIDTILSADDIVVSEVDLVLQLGEEAQNLVRIGAAGGVTVTANNVLIHDRSASGGGAIIMDSLTLSDMDVDGTVIGLVSSGLRITTPSTGGHSVSVMGLGFADGAGVRQNTVGDMYVDMQRNSASVITLEGR